MQKFKGGEKKFSILKNQLFSTVSIIATTSEIITQIFKRLPTAHSPFSAAREHFHVGVHTFHHIQIIFQLLDSVQLNRILNSNLSFNTDETYKYVKVSNLRYVGKELDLCSQINQLLWSSKSRFQNNLEPCWLRDKTQQAVVDD